MNLTYAQFKLNFKSRMQQNEVNKRIKEKKHFVNKSVATNSERQIFESS